MAKRQDREVRIEGARLGMPGGHDELLAELMASTARCVASAIKWGARDVGSIRVLLTSDESCLALHQCVSRYAALLQTAGESAERTSEILLAAIDLGATDVHVQDCIRSAVREWTLEAWAQRAAEAADPAIPPSVLPAHALMGNPDT